jgi:hypothetical protein
MTGTTANIRVRAASHARVRPASCTLHLPEVFVNRSTLTLRLWVFGTLMAGAAAPALAQTARMPPVDLWIGYEMQRVPDLNYPLGANVAVSGAMSPVWRLVGEVGMSSADTSAPRRPTPAR